MKSEDAVHALGALAQESRLAIFRALVKRGPDGYTPGELSQRVPIPAPTLSFHLKELHRAELISVQREGRFLRYSANFDTMNALVHFLTENCCSLGESNGKQSCAPPNTRTSRRARA